MLSCARSTQPHAALVQFGYLYVTFVLRTLGGQAQGFALEFVGWFFAPQGGHDSARVIDDSEMRLVFLSKFISSIIETALVARSGLGCLPKAGAAPWQM
jgi:hypothetical protein